MVSSTADIELAVAVVAGTDTHRYCWGTEVAKSALTGRLALEVLLE